MLTLKVGNQRNYDLSNLWIFVQQNDINIIVRSLQEHFAFKINNFSFFGSTQGAIDGFKNIDSLFVLDLV